MKIIGMMSGTSGDGIDSALCLVEGAPPRLTAKVLHGITIPYDAQRRRRILDACHPDTGNVIHICELNFELGAFFAEAALAVNEGADLIASHGQTIWHNVDASGTVTSTLQIGAPALLAEKTGLTVISNFRERDVTAGGQGAPLTAYVDWLLLRHESKWRAVQNIGGMGNVTVLPPLNEPSAEPLAFDTGPGNALIDAAVLHLTDGALSYDKDGEMALAGTIDGGWLEELLDHPYYHRQPPKTTGREVFGSQMARELVQEGQQRGRSASDIVATLTAVTAGSIAMAYQQFVHVPIGEVVIGGGGSRNPALMSMIQQHLPSVPVTTHEALGIDSDYKEALVFAVLAYETWHNRPATLPSLTGAAHASVLGQITPGSNYESLIRATWR